MIVPMLVLDALHARAALRVEVRRAAPGRSFLAAVEIATDPHWHVYWRNPGDSGVPTRITWRAPKGWKVEPLEYPIPKRFAPGGITAYGYAGKTLFLARVTPTKTPGTLAADVSWLVCREACVPGSASLKTNIPIGLKPTVGLSAPALRTARFALPGADADWEARAVKGKGVVLTATLAPNVMLTEKWVQAEFFPSESGAVDQGKPFLATLQGHLLVFKMDASPFPEGRTRLPGLIVLNLGGMRRAFTVNPKLETGE